MKVYVVNLDKDTARMASISSQLNRLGISYRRVSGVDGMELPDDLQRAAVNRFRWWCAVGRRIVPAEIGVALAHYGIYRQLGDEPVCILEDDVILDDRFATAIKEVEHFVNPKKAQVVLFSSCEGVRPGTGIIRSQSALCADGYVITPSAGKVLLKENYPLQVPCDWWGRWCKRGVIELYHYLPSVVCQNRSAFCTSTQANAKSVTDYSSLHWLCHKGKRVIGKAIDQLLTFYS